MVLLSFQVLTPKAIMEASRENRLLLIEKASMKSAILDQWSPKFQLEAKSFRLNKMLKDITYLQLLR